jgi:hypothetical protein
VTRSVRRLGPGAAGFRLLKNHRQSRWVPSLSGAAQSGLPITVSTSLRAAWPPWTLLTEPLDPSADPSAKNSSATVHEPRREANCFAVSLCKCQTQGATPAQPGDLLKALGRQRRSMSATAEEPMNPRDEEGTEAKARCAAGRFRSRIGDRSSRAAARAREPSGDWAVRAWQMGKRAHPRVCSRASGTPQQAGAAV